ncbi:MAG TPA: ABC transporter permease subunit [Acidimicrobiia bacterium]|nr:ABC transporter permease subunit [Acidimicrobiia bacterium]
MARRRSVQDSPWRIFFSNPIATVGFVIILLFAFMVLIHPLLMKTLWAGERDVYDPIVGYHAPVVEVEVVETVTDPATQMQLSQARLSDITLNVGDVVEMAIQPAPPSGTHWFGTDVFGRDVFSMILAGAWPTFVVGISAALVSATVAVIFSVSSATFKGRVDRALSRVSDVLLLLPAPLAMIILAGGTAGEFLTPLNFGITYGILAGASTAAIVLRSHALATVERPFIDAARVSGANGWYLARRHLLPHMIPLAAVTMVSAVVGAVVAHGFASWLAYSDDLSNWGAIMFVAIGFSNLQGVFAWNVLIAGAAAISIFCAGFYMISLGLKDVAFRGSDVSRANRPGWVRRLEMRT